MTYETFQCAVGTLEEISKEVRRLCCESYHSRLNIEEQLATQDRSPVKAIFYLKSHPTEVGADGAPMISKSIEVFHCKILPPTDVHIDENFRVRNSHN